VRVSVEEAMLQQLPKRALDADLNKAKNGCSIADTDSADGSFVMHMNWP
jgi:hypothetical protein